MDDKSGEQWGEGLGRSELSPENSGSALSTLTLKEKGRVHTSVASGRQASAL